MDPHPTLARIVVTPCLVRATSAPGCEAPRRARSLRREIGEDALEGTPARPDPPGHGLSEEIAGALAGLSPEHRAVVVLRYLLEYTPGEIASLLDLPRGTVNSRLRRALDTLEGRLEEERP